MAINTILRNIYYVLKKSWRYEKAILIILFAQTLIGVVVPAISVYMPSIILDSVLVNVNLGMTLWKVTALVLLISICNCISAYCGATYDTHLMNNKIHFLTDLYRKNMELDYEYVESEEGQNQLKYVMFSLLNEDKSISGMLNHLGVLCSSLSGIVLYVGILSNLDLWVVFILFVASIVHLFIVNEFLKRQHNFKEEWTDIDRKIDYLNNYLRDEKSYKDIQIFCMKNWMIEIANNLIYKRIHWVKQLAQYDLFMALSDVAILIIRDGVAYFCILAGLFSDRLEISQFTLYFGIITGLSVFMTNLTSEFAYISQRSREIDSLRDYMMREPSGSKQNSMLLANGVPVTIEFRNVTFRFTPDGSNILSDINIKIKPGEKIALVGENGAGKTTLIKLLCGLYRPTEGQILINGIDICDYSQEMLSSYFALAFQDVHVLPMSVGENIAFGDVSKNENAIKKCLELADMDEKLNDIHDHLTKMIHSDGIILSGGQEQRLILARTIYKADFHNCPILILDEPTAALDPLAEKMFYEKYNELASDRTSVFISHRLASTRFCDRILVMKGGEIIEEGSHQQLMDKKGYYRELFDIQCHYYM